jgi:uncharacterized delta-60 repeat protein
MNTLRFHFALFVIGLFLIFNASPLQAQSALDGFDWKTNGPVYAVVVQPDGKILIGGQFTTITQNGVQVLRNCIARFNADGTVDMAFDPHADQTVFTIALSSRGILVGGRFTVIGSQQRNYVARLDSNGLADGWNPSPWNPDPYFGLVHAVAEQADGKILIAGDFHKLGGAFGQVRISLARVDGFSGQPDSFSPNNIYNRLFWLIVIQPDGRILVPNGPGGIMRIDPVTGLPDSFNAQSNGPIYSIAIQPDGKILVGGDFTSIGGQPRNRLARLDPLTGLADSFNPNASGGFYSARVYSIAIQPDGRILAGGNFTNIGGQPRQGIARLDAITGQPDSFNPDTPRVVNAVAVQRDDKIFIGGGESFGSNGIARFERDGRPDRTLNLDMVGSSTAGGSVLAIAVQADGKILIGGVFTSVLGVPRVNIARLNSDGTLDTNFNPDIFGGRVDAIAVQADGKIVVGGYFSYIGGQVRTGIARLDPITGLADSFNPGANDGVGTIAIQPDGKILIGGVFTDVGGQPRNRLARLDKDTGMPDSFDPNANSWVSAITVQPDGKILIGGAFTNIGGQARSYLARLDAATGMADSFDSNADNWLHSIVVQPDGKILVGGSFTNIGGQARNHMARLNATTGVADSFNPNASAAVYSIIVQPNNKILVCGGFSVIGGQPRSEIARLDATTGAADSFNPNPNSSVPAIAIQSDGKILAGGGFTNIGGQPRNLFARLTNDDAALSTLSVSRTTVTLTRNGSAALFARVVFELSTDNGANWTTLGTAAANGFAPSSLPTGTKETGENQFAPLAPGAAGYTLAGLNLPTGQNILVRARGFLRGGTRNGSESIEDKMQIAFLPAPTAAQVSVSGRVFIADGSGGLKNASVVLTGANGGRQAVVTGSFGYFRFDAVQAGETYIVSIVAKGYQFAPQAVTVNEELSELNFTALE